MTTIEIIISASSMAFGIGSIVYVRHLIRTAGRDRPEDPERVRKFLRDAPYERLRRVLDP